MPTQDWDKYQPKVGSAPFEILAYAATFDGITLPEITSHAGFPLDSGHTHLSRLRRAGFVKHTHHTSGPHDPPRPIKLTRKGRRLVAILLAKE